MLLIGAVSRSHLETKLLTRLTLLHRDLIELRSKASVRLLELRHLCIGKSDPFLRELRNLRAELLLERRAIAAFEGRADGLRKGGGSAERRGNRGQPQDLLHALNHDQ